MGGLHEQRPWAGERDDVLALDAPDQRSVGEVPRNDSLNVRMKFS
jgi:hypothetical protein